MNIKNSKINYYLNYGVVVLRNVIPSFWLKKLRNGIEKNFENPSKYKCVYEREKGKELFYDDYCNWQNIKEYKDFFFNSNIAKIASNIMKSKEVRLFHEHVLIKEPGSKKKTPWHQDQPYYCVNGKDNCSLWIPLDNIHKSICPEFIKSSHKWNKKYLPTKFFGELYEKHDDEFENIPNIDINRNNYDIVSWSLRPGDLIAFNFSTIHGAPGNSTNTKRRAFSARFVGDDATFAKRKGETSPPFPDIDLRHGDKLISSFFPLIPI